ncbi:MAG TPA: MlaD family protein [Gemmatirosa sp.]|nr:MlaD family protein [Gemmatirosa sp.]
MKRRDEVLVGLLLTIAILVGVVGTIWLARGGLSRGYPLYSVFRWGANLKVGQAVRLAGVQVGTVGAVRLNDDGTLVVDLSIEKGRRVPRNARAVVQSVGIFGDAEVGLIGTPSTSYYAAGDTVPAGVPAAGIAELTAKGDSVASTAVRVSRELERQLVDSGGITDLRRTLVQTNALVAQLGAVAAQQNRELSRTQASLRRTLEAVNPQTVDSTLRNVRTTSANAAALTDSLRLTASRLNATLGRLERGEGTAGKLLSDTLLYTDVRRLVARFDSLASDVQRNPGRYTRGVVRIF